MVFKTRLIPLALSCALAIALVGCSSEDTSWVMQYGEEKVPAGIYLYNMIGAYSDAGGMVEDTEKEILSQQVDGQDASAWIVQKAQQYTREYIAAEEKFTELGLSLSEEQQNYIIQMTDYQWQYLGDAYTENGIAKSSMQKTLENSMKQSVIFESIYGKEGTEPVPEADLLAKYQEDYTRSQYIAISKKTGKGEPVTEEELEKSRNEIQGYYDRAVKGENFEDIILEYEKAHTPAEQEVHEHATPGMHDVIVGRTSTSFPQKYVDEVFGAPIGTPIQVEDDSYFYVILRKELLGDGADFEQKRSNLLTELKGDEFQERLKSWAEELGDVTVNQAAIDLYTPKKIKL